MYLKKWRRQKAQLCAILESTDSDEATGPSSSTDILIQDQSDTTDVQLHNQLDTEYDYQDDHHPPDSDDSDSEVEHFSEKESSNLKTDLAKWAVKNRVMRTSIDELLSVLRQHGHRLPKDARTLLGTPPQIEVMDLCGGQFLYFGVQTGLLKLCSEHPAFFQQALRSY